MSALDVEKEIQRRTDERVEKELHEKDVRCSDLVYLPTSPNSATPYRIGFPNQRQTQMRKEEICDPAKLWLDTMEGGSKISGEGGSDKTTILRIVNTVLAEAAGQEPTNSTPAFYDAAIARAASSLYSSLRIDLADIDCPTSDCPTSDLESNVTWTIVDRDQLVDPNRHIVPFRGDEKTAYGTRPEPDQYIEVSQRRPISQE